MKETGTIDTAKIIISSFIEEPFYFFTRSVECLGCDFSNPKEVGYLKNNSFLVDTKYGTEINLSWDSKKADNPVCPKSFRAFQVHGDWLINVTRTENKSECFLEGLSAHDNQYLPLLWSFIFFAFLIVLWLLGKAVYKYNCFRFSEEERLIISDLGSPDELAGVYHITANQESVLTPSHGKKRLRSLDTFRGISVVLMMFVEYGGGKYSFFEHARWNGLTFADLVFPWFMWIMGASIALSVYSSLRRSERKLKFFLKVLRRAALLFLLGLLLNTAKTGWEIKTMRIMGVLQRFSVTYLIVASVELIFSHVDDPIQIPMSTWDIRDIRRSWRQWIIMIIFVVIHTLLTFLLPIKGCPRGYLGPGGLEMHGEFANCTGGSAGYIDRVILGTDHMYQKPTCQAIYRTTLPYDPEGILGVLTATFMVFLGLQAGKIIILYGDHSARICRWLIWSVITGVIGIVLCWAGKNDGWIPLNKNLWSLSFVLVLAATGYALLAVCYFVIDKKSKWSGAPFYYAGMNPIVLYIGLEFTKNVFPFGWVGCDSHGCYLAVAIWGTSLWVIIAGYMHYKRFYIAI